MQASGDTTQSAISFVFPGQHDWDVTNEDVPVRVNLSPEERLFLLEGLRQWGGPAYPTEELAVAMGFLGMDDMRTQRERMARQLDDGVAMTRLDWTRMLVCAEVIFASDVFGAGVEWEIVTPLDDQSSIALLRAVQRKLAAHTTRIGSHRPRN